MLDMGFSTRRIKFREHRYGNMTYRAVGFRAHAENDPCENLVAVPLDIQKLYSSGEQPAADVPSD